MERRSVLVCTWRDRWHPDAGGAEVYLHNVSTRLAAAGWSVTVATASYPGAPAEEVRDGIRHVRRGGTFTVYPRIAAHYLLGGLGRPDVVVDVQNGVSFLASVWARRPVVVLHHHAHRAQWRTLFGPLLGRLGWFLESRVAPLLQRRARYVTVSAASRRALVEQGVSPGRITVVHNGVDPLTGTVPAEAGGPRLVVLGRLVPHKRVELAIDVVAGLVPTLPGLRLDVVGGGDWLPELRAHAARTGVSDHVVFHGHVDEVTKAHLLGRAWVQLLPSSMEGWGLVVMEAALASTPTVAFADAGGVGESVRDGETGLLADDVDGFVGAARRLLTDHELRRRLGRAARERARGFDWDSTAAGFAVVLDDAVASGTPSAPESP